MNTYGKFAQEAWRATAPTEYALIPDPDQWFEALGEEAAQRVGELMMELAGPDPMGETYLEKVGRLNASKMQAEEIVRAEMLTPDPSVQEEPEEEDEEESGVARRLRIVQQLNREDREYWEEVGRLDAEQA
ncbi:TnpV protein [Kocuria rosea]|uniref:TnpV protein n=1 Tax=Kocuria rosea TaxID=1275 RepID=UPI002B24B219|nr:TnpV protein [Kocuria rosea]MEB2528718.1 TnpV protein [Kocuria rosea]MEB2619596.1 TnpV protein [Kocuria rosea]